MNVCTVSVLQLKGTRVVYTIQSGYPGTQVYACVCTTQQDAEQWRCVNVAQCVCFPGFARSPDTNYSSLLLLLVALPWTSWAGGFRARHDRFHHVVPVHVRCFLDPVFAPNVCTGRHEQPDTGQFVVLHCRGRR